MLLNEISRPITSENHAAVIREVLGVPFSVQNLSERRAEKLLQEIQQKIFEFRSTSKYYNSEKSSSYLGLLIAEQALLAEISQARLLELQKSNLKQVVEKNKQKATVDYKKITGDFAKKVSACLTSMSTLKDSSEEINYFVEALTALMQNQTPNIGETSEEDAKNVREQVNNTLKEIINTKDQQFKSVLCVLASEKLQDFVIYQEKQHPEEKNEIDQTEFNKMQKELAVNLQNLKSSQTDLLKNFLGHSLGGFVGAFIGGLQGHALQSQHGKIHIPDFTHEKKFGKTASAPNIIKLKKVGDIPKYIGHMFSNQFYDKSRSEIEKYAIDLFNLGHSQQATKITYEDIANDLHKKFPTVFPDQEQRLEVARSLFDSVYSS